MIPRFNYSYSLRDAWITFRGLLSSQRPDNAILNALFPASSLSFVSSARVGINYALQAFDLKKGALVGVQPYTCSSVLAAIAVAGYKPVFIDINEQLSIDINDLRRKRAQLDALIVTHIFGIPADIRQIKQIIGILPVLEDCAHAFLSRYEGIPVGNFFDAAVFSFGDGKFPSFGSGGLLVINNPKYTERAVALLNGLSPQEPLNEVTLIGKRLLKAIIHSRVGGLLQHRLLLENNVSKRNENVAPYPDSERQSYRSLAYTLQKQLTYLNERALRQHDNARYLTERNNSRYTLLFDSDAGNAFAVILLNEHRDYLYNYLRNNGIGAGKHFQHAKVWIGEFGYQPGECPNFEQLIDTVLTIPCHYGLSQRDLDKINQCLHNYVR